MNECKYCNWWKPDTFDGRLCVKCGRKYRGLARVGETWCEGPVKFHFVYESFSTHCLCGSRDHTAIATSIDNWYCPISVAAHFKLIPIEEPNNLYCGDPSPVHTWFELTYAAYLTIPRCVLEAMPVEWQNRFTECLEELEKEIWG